MGGASARLAGTYDARGEATVVNIKVAGGRMSAPELEAFLPALGIHLPRGAPDAARDGVRHITAADCSVSC